MALTIGSEAPNFEAETTEGKIDFHDWIGDSWAVLFSHPRDFTPVCTTELGYMAKIKPDFEGRDVKIIGLSVDQLDNHEAWAADIEETQGTAPNYPIISDSDFNVSKLYGMLPADVDGDPTERTPAQNQTVRNVFVIGPDKTIKLILVYPMTTGRNFDEVLRVIDSLQLTAKHKVATPAQWQPGEDVIIAGSVSNDQAKEIWPDGWQSPKPYIRIVPSPNGSSNGTTSAFEVPRAPAPSATVQLCAAALLWSRGRLSREVPDDAERREDRAADGAVAAGPRLRGLEHLVRRDQQEERDADPEHGEDEQTHPRRLREQGDLQEAGRALDLEHPPLGGDAARGGESVQRAGGREHAVARHDDRVRVRAEGGADRPCGVGRPDDARDLPVGRRLAGTDRPRGRVHGAAEVVDAVLVEDDLAQIAALAGEQRDHAFDRGEHARRGVRRAGRQARTGQLHRGDPPRAPVDAAGADRRLEPHRRRRYRRRQRTSMTPVASPESSVNAEDGGGSAVIVPSRAITTG